MTPHADVRSLPSGPATGPFVILGGLASLESARREAA